MSRERQLARAQRERAASERASARRVEHERAAVARARRQRRRLAWRRVRLWQHGPGFRRRREAWGALATLDLVILLLVYLVTRAPGDVLVVTLVLIVCTPVLVMLFIDRRNR